MSTFRIGFLPLVDAALPILAQQRIGYLRGPLLEA